MNGGYTLADAAKYAVPLQPVHAILYIANENHKEVIRIANDGRIFWHGREVETDDDFRSAMMELAQRLAAR